MNPLKRFVGHVSMLLCFWNDSYEPTVSDYNQYMNVKTTPSIFNSVTVYVTVNCFVQKSF